MWPVDRSSRSRRSRRHPSPPFVLPILPFNRTKTSSARRDDSRGMNTVVQGLAEVPGSFLPSCPHVSTSEATCQRKEKIGIFPSSFFPISGSIPRCFLRHVESRPKGARIVITLDKNVYRNSGLVVFSLPLFIGKYVSLGL